MGVRKSDIVMFDAPLRWADTRTEIRDLRFANASTFKIR